MDIAASLFRDALGSPHSPQKCEDKFRRATKKEVANDVCPGFRRAKNCELQFRCARWPAPVGTTKNGLSVDRTKMRGGPSFDLKDGGHLGGDVGERRHLLGRRTEEREQLDLPLPPPELGRSPPSLRPPWPGLGARLPTEGFNWLTREARQNLDFQLSFLLLTFANVYQHHYIVMRKMIFHRASRGSSSVYWLFWGHVGAYLVTICAIVVPSPSRFQFIVTGGFQPVRQEQLCNSVI